MTTSLKNTILDAWARAQNEHERGQVLAEIESARHEIRIEYLWAEPKLRAGLADLEGKCTEIMRGQYRIGEIRPREPDPLQREAPLVGLAGYVAMLLALRSEHQERMHDELRGGATHACRVDEAQRVRHHPARPIKGCTGYVNPVDPLSVSCPICRVGVGVKCMMGRVEEIGR